MGGTSTDVAHYAGEFERAFETEVAGVRMRAPMMAIHTVAAGGGSILALRRRPLPGRAGVRRRQSGPACYRRGGPLTVTDANLLVGKLQPAFLPAGVRPGGGPAARRARSCRRSSSARGRVQVATGAPRRRRRSPTASSRSPSTTWPMRSRRSRSSAATTSRATRSAASAAPAASTPAGSPMRWAWSACLSIRWPSVLSAYGMGLADVRTLRQRALEAPLESRADAELEATIAAPRGRGARRARRARACPRIGCDRARGARSATAAPTRALEVAARRRRRRCVAAFEAEHRARYGFVESRAGRSSPRRSRSRRSAGWPRSTSPSGRPRRAPRRRWPGRRGRLVTPRLAPAAPRLRRAGLERADLRPGDAVRRAGDHRRADHHDRGRAGLARPELTARDHLVLTRHRAAAARRPRSAPCRPGHARGVQQPLHVDRRADGRRRCRTPPTRSTSRSGSTSPAPSSTAEGDLIANAPHMPVHLGSMGEGCATIIRARRGDAAGRRLRAQRPLQRRHPPARHHRGHAGLRRAAARLLFFTASRGHHADIGGITPGSMPPDSRTIDEEGVLIDNFQLVDGGRFREAETARAARRRAQSRRATPTQNIADLQAQVAAYEKGAQELRRDDRAVRPRRRPGLHAATCRTTPRSSVRRVLDALNDGELRLCRWTTAREIRVADHASTEAPQRARRLHRHVARSSRTTSTRPSAVSPRRGALRLPHPGRRRHPDERRAA